MQTLHISNNSTISLFQSPGTKNLATGWKGELLWDCFYLTWLHDELSLHVCVKNREKCVFYFWYRRRGSVTTESLAPKSIEWFIEGQVFLRRLIRPFPTSPVSKLSLFFSLSVFRRSRLWWEKGGGSGRGAVPYDHETAKSLALYKSFNTLWLELKENRWEV